jgi:hypothetical protein
MLIDDLTGGFGTRHEAREHLDSILSKSLNWTPDAPDEETWGMTPEAIASQDDPFWSHSWR